MKPDVSPLTGDAAAKAEWIRLPRPGARCPYTGLSRSTLTELCVPRRAYNGAPPVKSVVICKPGAIRGIRLVSYPSLMSYLASLIDAPTTTAKQGKVKTARQQ